MGAYSGAEAYLSKSLLRVGDYLGGGLFGRGGLINHLWYIDFSYTAGQCILMFWHYAFIRAKLILIIQIGNWPSEVDALICIHGHRRFKLLLQSKFH